jgi:hypothetical protein
MARNRGCGSHGRRKQMGAAATALTAFKIAVGGGSTTLPRFQLVRIHRKAHRTTRFTPVETRLDKDLVEAFFLSLMFHKARARDHHRVYMGCNLLAFGNGRGRAQVFHPPIGAGADENTIDLHRGKRRTGFQIHIGERAFGGSTLVFISHLCWIGHSAGHRQGLFGAGAPGDHRRNIGSVERDLGIEDSIVIRFQRSPIDNRRFEGRSFGCTWTARDIGECRFIRRDQTCAGTRLDRHVAKGHTPFH